MFEESPYEEESSILDRIIGSAGSTNDYVRGTLLGYQDGGPVYLANGGTGSNIDNLAAFTPNVTTYVPNYAPLLQGYFDDIGGISKAAAHAMNTAIAEGLATLEEQDPSKWTQEQINTFNRAIQEALIVAAAEDPENAELQTVAEGLTQLWQDAVEDEFYKWLNYEYVSWDEAGNEKDDRSNIAEFLVKISDLIGSTPVKNSPWLSSPSTLVAGMTDYTMGDIAEFDPQIQEQWGEWNDFLGTFTPTGDDEADILVGVDKAQEIFGEGSDNAKVAILTAASTAGFSIEKVAKAIGATAQQVLDALPVLPSVVGYVEDTLKGVWDWFKTCQGSISVNTSGKITSNHRCQPPGPGTPPEKAIVPIWRIPGTNTTIGVDLGDEILNKVVGLLKAGGEGNLTWEEMREAVWVIIKGKLGDVIDEKMKEKILASLASELSEEGAGTNNVALSVTKTCYNDAGGSVDIPVTQLNCPLTHPNSSPPSTSTRKCYNDAGDSVDVEVGTDCPLTHPSETEPTVATEAETRCTQSGGTWDNGICSCGDDPTIELVDGQCMVKDDSIRTATQVCEFNKDGTTTGNTWDDSTDPGTCRAPDGNVAPENPDFTKCEMTDYTQPKNTDGSFPITTQYYSQTELDDLGTGGLCPVSLGTNPGDPQQTCPTNAVIVNGECFCDTSKGFEASYDDNGVLTGCTVAAGFTECTGITDYNGNPDADGNFPVVSQNYSATELAALPGGVCPLFFGTEPNISPPVCPTNAEIVNGECHCPTEKGFEASYDDNGVLTGCTPVAGSTLCENIIDYNQTALADGSYPTVSQNFSAVELAALPGGVCPLSFGTPPGSTTPVCPTNAEIVNGECFCDTDKGYQAVYNDDGVMTACLAPSGFTECTGITDYNGTQDAAGNFPVVSQNYSATELAALPGGVCPTQFGTPPGISPPVCPTNAEIVNGECFCDTDKGYQAVYNDDGVMTACLAPSGFTLCENITDYNGNPDAAGNFPVVSQNFSATELAALPGGVCPTQFGTAPGEPPSNPCASIDNSYLNEIGECECTGGYDPVYDDNGVLTACTRIEGLICESIANAETNEFDECVCKEGYKATYTDGILTSCTKDGDPAECPIANSSKDADGNCNCNVGYSGVYTDGVLTSCTKDGDPPGVTCPIANSSPDADGNCVCDDKYEGTYDADGGLIVCTLTVPTCSDPAYAAANQEECQVVNPCADPAYALANPLECPVDTPYTRKSAVFEGIDMIRPPWVTREDVTINPYPDVAPSTYSTLPGPAGSYDYGRASVARRPEDIRQAASVIDPNYEQIQAGGPPVFTMEDISLDPEEQARRRAASATYYDTMNNLADYSTQFNIGAGELSESLGVPRANLNEAPADGGLNIHGGTFNYATPEYSTGPEPEVEPMKRFPYTPPMGPMLAEGGEVRDEPQGLESLLDRRQQAVNKMLWKRTQ